MATKILFLNDTFTRNSTLLFSYGTEFLAHINKQNSYIQWFIWEHPKVKDYAQKDYVPKQWRINPAVKSGVEKKKICATNPVLLKYTVLPLAVNLGVFSKCLQDLETHAVFSEMRVNRKHIHLKASLKYSWIRNLKYNS